MVVRCLAVVNAVAIAPGGGATYLVNQARAFEQEMDDWDFVYFVNRECGALLRAAVTNARIEVPFGTRPSVLVRTGWEQFILPRLLRRMRPDIVYNIAGFAVFAAGAPQVVFNQNPNHHATMEELGLSSTYFIARVQRIAARFSAIKAAEVVVPTQAYAEAMRGVGVPNTQVIPSGVAIDFPVALGTGPPAGRYALAVHNWYRHKRVEWLMETWCNNERLHDRRTLVLVGQPVDRKTTRQVRSLMSTGPTSDRVKTVESATRADVAGFYAGAEFYLSASTLEAFPLTPFEAMRFRVPCVLSDIPTHREVAGDAAVFFNPYNGDALVRAIDEATSRRTELIDRGLRRIEEFTWRDNARKFRGCFRTLARQHMFPSPPAAQQ